MNSTPIAALLIGRAFHHVDHLAPLCSLFGLPLIVTDIAIAETTREFYPDVEIKHVTENQLAKFIVAKFQAVVSCFTKPVLERLFFLQEDLQQRKVATIWCPHGNSDKGWKESFMQALKDEECVLYYGKKMLAFIEEQGALSQTCTYISIGNYRQQYYNAHKAFYDRLCRKKLSPKLKTVLYAPTWDDSEQNSTLSTLLPKLAKNLPKETQLIVKIHPNDQMLMSPELMQLIFRLEDLDNIIFLHNFPPIHPLLDCINGYIGDMSSIGYDFLAYRKPMFFDKKQDMPLFACGESVDAFFQMPNEWTVLQPNFAQKQLDLYNYTFDQPPQKVEFWDSIRKVLSLPTSSNT